MTSTITAIASPAPEERPSRSGEYSRLRKTSDTSLVSAMELAGKTEGEGFVAHTLAVSGINLASDRIYIQSLVQAYPPTSPVHLLSLDARLALALQGHAFAPRLLEMAEKHLLDGMPAANIDRTWSEKKAKDIRDAARAVRSETRAAAEPPSVIIERLRTEVNLANARAERAEQAQEQALKLAEELADKIGRLQQGFIVKDAPSQEAA
jgi:predicted Zn-dependent protease